MEVMNMSINTRTDLVGSFVEVILPDDDSFLKIRETLTRMGVPKKNKVLEQPCYLLHKKGKYFLCHFLELLALDGNEIKMKNSDLNMRDSIVDLLEVWELLEVKSDLWEPPEESAAVKVIPFKQKKDWDLVPLYRIGN